MDARTHGSHTWWVEVWISDDLMPGPQGGSSTVPRNAIGLQLSNDCGKSGQLGALHYLSIVRNYNASTTIVDRDNNPAQNDACYLTQDHVKNHFQIRIKRARARAVGVGPWRRELPPRVPHRRLPDVPLTRGYVTFEHVHYSAAKDGAPSAQTYHWDNIGFDGPRLPLDRAYDVPDALAAGRAEGSLNLGYTLDGARTFNVDNVDPSGVAAGFIDANIYWTDHRPTLRYRLNDGPVHTYDWPFAQARGYQWHGVSIPIDPRELQPGSNAIELQVNQQQIAVANVDLELVPSN